MEDAQDAPVSSCFKLLSLTMFDKNCTIAQHVAHVPLSVAAREIRRQEPGGTSRIFAVDMLVFQALVSIGAKKIPSGKLT